MTFFLPNIKQWLVVIGCLLAGNTMAQLQNFGNLHVFSGTNMLVKTSFTNAPVSTLTYLNDGTLYTLGDFTNNQTTMPAGTGTTNFNGTILQNINGTQPSVFYNAVVNNSLHVKMAKDITVAGTYTPQLGSLIINGNTLTISGTVSGTLTNAGTITGSTTSNIVLSGSGNVTGALSFAVGGQTLNNLTLTRGASGVATLGTSLTVNNTANLVAGALAIGGQTLTLSGNIVGAGTLTGSAASNLTIGGSSATSVGVLSFTSGAQLLNNFTLNRTVSTAKTAAAVLGTSVLVKALTLTKGVLATGYNVFTWDRTGTYTAPATSTTSWIATCDAAGTPVTPAMASNGHFTGVAGMQVKNITGNNEIEFAVGADLTSPNRMKLNMNNAISRDITVVVGYGDIGNTPSARVNRIWYLHPNNEDTTNVRANMKLYFFKRGAPFLSVQNEVEQPFNYDSIKLVQKDSRSNTYFINQSSGADVYTYGGIPGEGTELYARYNVGVSKNYTGKAIGINQFNQLSIIGGTGVVLPVTFTAINAYAQGADIAINWTVASETDIAHYEVERATDGRLFTTIATQTANNVGAQMHTYKSVDTQPVAGANYYRVKAVGKNGEISYTNIVNVSLAGDKKYSMQVFPNPVSNQKFTLQLNNLPQGSYQVAVYSGSGQLVLGKKIQHAGGTTSQLMYLPAGTAAGVYRLLLTGTGVQMTSSVFVF